MRLVPLIAGLVVGVGAAACGPTPPLADAGHDAGPHLPCEVDAVLRARCQGCHSSPVAQGAPFPLLSQADFLAPYLGRPVWEVAIGAIDANFMPLNGPPLNAADRAVLIGWLDAGVPLSTTNCP